MITTEKPHKRSTAQAPRTEARAQEGLSTAPANPLLSVGAWVTELSLYGLGVGLMAGLNEMASPTDLLAIPPALAGLAMMGALSGAIVGLALKTLRGRVPPLLGLLLAALGPGALYGLALISADAQSAKLWTVSLAWSLMVVPLVPLAAVRRTRGQPTALSNIVLGVLAGAIILAVKFLIGW